MQLRVQPSQVMEPDYTVESVIACIGGNGTECTVGTVSVCTGLTVCTEGTVPGSAVVVV